LPKNKWYNPVKSVFKGSFNEAKEFFLKKFPRKKEFLLQGNEKNDEKK
jgi:hypothetical protein